MIELNLSTKLIVFAQGAPLPPTSTQSGNERKVEILSNDMALMVGLGILALLILAFFAKQSFSSERRKRKRVSESRSVPDASTLPRIPSPAETRKKNKRRRRKRSHRPSNPTIGETGGLPPQRHSSRSSKENRS